MSQGGVRQKAMDDETAALSWSQKIFTKMSGKQDQHHFITSVISNDNKELYKAPHMLTLYATAFKQVNMRSKAFCTDIFQVQWRETELAIDDDKPDAQHANQMQREMLKY